MQPTAKPPTAKDFSEPILLLTLGTQILDAISKMLDERVEFAVCIDGNRNIRGVLTASNILEELAHDVTSSLITQGVIEQIMTETVNYVRDNAVMLEVLKKINQYHRHSLVVLDGMEPIGIINRLNVLQWWNDEIGSKPESI